MTKEYSQENPEVWGPSEEEVVKKEVPVLINLFNRYGKVKYILDVGCGMGRHAYLLSKKGYTCEGVEAHPKMVEYARGHYPGVIYKIRKMQDINYKNKFDALICIYSIIVFNKSNEEAIKTFKNFYKALKKDGILIIETYNNIHWISEGFKKHYVNIYRKRDEKEVIREWINFNNQSVVSEREYFRLSDSKKIGSFIKESRMFFPLELKFFLESAGFKVLTILSADSLNKITLKDTILDKRRLLVVAKKK